MILIVGGAGYIGSHVNKELHKRGYDTVVYDNLIYGHKEAVKWGHFEYGDLRDTNRLEQIFVEENTKYFTLCLTIASKRLMVATTLLL